MDSIRRRRAKRSPITDAISDWRRLLGAQHVDTRDAALAAVERATYRTEQRVLAIIRPRNTPQLVACVQVANEHGVPLYPVSGGRNWGYGSRVPVEDGSVIVDLGRMNRVREHDERLAYVVVEAGVSFEALQRFLAKAGSRLAPVSVGSSAQASVVGNVLERGFGQGGYPDRMAHVCGLEVVLPTGAVLRTGFSRFAGARAAHVNRWGLGPSLDGLFTQSNLGIVTRMAIWLRPTAPLRDLVQFSIEDARDLPGLLDALQSLRLREVLRGGCAISTRERVVAMTQQYPWDDAGGVTPLPAQVIARVRRLGVGRWMGWAVAGYEDRAQRRAMRGLIREALAPRVDALRFRPMLGSPPIGREPNLPYWRKRSPRPVDPDPDRDGCGVLMFSPVVPFDGREVATVTALIARQLRSHGFDPIVQVQCTSERSVIVNTMILFDRDVARDEAKALACYQSLARALVRRGYHPYRRTTLGMPTRSDDEHGRLLEVLKRAVDPNQILAPGRSIPSARRMRSRRSGGKK